MSERWQSKNNDEGAAFVIHYKLVDGTFEPVDLLLNSDHDLLNLLDTALLGGCGQIDAKTYEHDSR